MVLFFMLILFGSGGLKYGMEKFFDWKGMWMLISIVC